LSEEKYASLNKENQNNLKLLNDAQAQLRKKDEQEKAAKKGQNDLL
jgi:hypothetical protein